MANSNFTEFPERNDLAKETKGKARPTGFRGKTVTHMNIKPGPAGGLPGKSQRRSRNPGGKRGGKFNVKSEGI